MVKISKWEASKYLDNPEIVAEYLSAALATNDVNLMLKALRNVARAQGMTEIAEKAGVGRASLYKSLEEGAQPKFETIMKLMNAFGLHLSAAVQHTEEEPRAAVHA